jgi:two-component sensor histidine kinase
MRVPPRSYLITIARAWRPNGDASLTARYGWALVILAVAVVVGVLFHPFLPERIFITIFPGVAVASVVSGVGPSILIAVLGGLIAIYLWTLPEPGWPLASEIATNLAVFLGMTGIIIFFGHLIRNLVDELRTAEHETELRAGEMHHRIQNLFGLIMAMGRGTVSGSQSAESFWLDMESRLRGLSHAQSLIVKPEEGVEMEALIVKVLSGHDISRFRLLGPPCLVRTSTPLVLGLNELATNSMKYGALSAESGHVEIEWEAGQGQITVRWAEHGGPPVVAPSRCGFGSKVLRSLNASREFDPAGLRATFSIVGSAIDRKETEKTVSSAGQAESRGKKTIDVSAILKIEPTASGEFVARIGTHWLPGKYATAAAARSAVLLPDRVLRALWGDESEELPPARSHPFSEEELTRARQRWLADSI